MYVITRRVSCGWVLVPERGVEAERGLAPARITLGVEPEGASRGRPFTLKGAGDARPNFKDGCSADLCIELGNMLVGNKGKEFRVCKTSVYA